MPDRIRSAYFRGWCGIPDYVGDVADRPVASFSATQRFGRFGGTTGPVAHIAETTLMTQLGSRMCIAAVWTNSDGARGGICLPRAHVM